MFPGSVLLARLAGGDFSGELLSDITRFIQGKAAAVPPDEDLLSFLPTFFQLLQAVLLRSPPAQPPNNAADGLFAVYRHALDLCHPQSSSNSMKLIRSKALWWISLVQALKEWKRVDEAESEAIRAYDSIHAETFGVEVDPSDYELASRLILLNSFLIASHFKKQPIECDHGNIVRLLAEVSVWMRYVDPEMFIDLQSSLATLFGKALLPMLKNHSSFEWSTIQNFCMITLKLHLHGLMKHVVRKIFGSFDYNPPHLVILHLIRCCLDLLLCDCKINLRTIANEVLSTLCDILRLSLTVSESENLIKDMQKLLSSYEATFSQVANFSVIFSALFCALFALDHEKDIGLRMHELANFIIPHNLPVCIGTQDSSSCGMSHGNINIYSYISTFSFLCCCLYLNAQADPRGANASYITGIFHNFGQALFHFINEMNGLDNNTVVKCGSTLFHLSIAIFRFSVENGTHLERSKHLIASVIKSNWVGDKLQSLNTQLFCLAIRFLSLKEYEKALYCLEVFFIGAWEHASLHGFVFETCKKIVFYLNTLRMCDSHNVNNVIINSLSHLTKDDDHFNEKAVNIIVEGWVQMKCEQNNVDMAKSLYCIIPTSCSKNHVVSILRKELLSYEQRELRYPRLCTKVEREIIKILTRTIGQDDKLGQACLLIKEARILRVLGHREIHKCIASLTEGVRILNGKHENLSILERHYLAVAHCLTAMSIHELHPNFEVVSAHAHIYPAIELWSSIGHLNLQEEDPIISEMKNSLPLIYHIADFLSMKGIFVYHFEIYKMIMMLNNQGIESFLKSLMACHSLRHSLCTSPIDCGLLDKFWLDCTSQTNQSWLLSFVDKSLSVSLCEEEYTSQLSDVDAILDGPDAFWAANILYDNSERLMYNGKLVEAFLLARKALLSRTIFLKQKFHYVNEVGVSGENLDNKVCKLWFHIKSSTATELWPSASCGRNLDKAFLSSWKILASYLESRIQVGNILEKMGNSLEALQCLRKGYNLSSFMGLNNFQLVFKLSLGKIYGKKKKIDFAISEFDDCRVMLRSHKMSCIQCQRTLDISLGLERGLVLCNNNDRVGALLLLRETLKNLSNIENERPATDAVDMSEERMRLSSLLSLKCQENRIGFCLNLIIGKLVSTSNESFENLATAACRISSGKSINMNVDRFLCFCELLGENIANNVFSLERATLLYEVSLFTLKTYIPNQTSKIKDNIFEVMTWLLDAFIIACQYPLLFQKISALLAIVFMFFGEQYISMEGSKYCWMEWSAYFHQSSVGPHFYSGKYLYKKHDDITSVRFIPSKIDQFQKCVEDFFVNIPSLLIICMSPIEDEHGKLVRDLFQTEVQIETWLILTRFSPNGKPLTDILPLETLKEMRNRDEERYVDDAANGKAWVSRWDSSSIIHKVVPQYESFRKEIFLSGFPSRNPEHEESREKRLRRVLNLDKCLGTFLEDIEELWFGPWKCLFEGEMIELDKNSEILLARLKENYKLDARREQLAKIILTGNLTVLEKETCLSEVVLNVQSMPSWALDAIKKLELKEVQRLPFILVIDADIQMISWECLPIMIGQEVYRMPAMGIINLLLKHPVSQSCPSIDVSNTYYMINPDADKNIAKYKLQIRELCQSQTWKGTIDKKPSIKELVFELENHDFFIYYGHGQALQFIREKDIGPLKNCPATMLLSCNGANAGADGVYRSVCTAFDFVLGGSPLVMANLWEVSAIVTDTFGTKLVNAWLDCAKKEAVKCAVHTSLNVEKDGIANCTCKQNKTLASFVPAARKASRLRYLMGASTVMLGVPAFTGKSETRE